MIKKLIDKNLTIQCKTCGFENNIDVTGVNKQYIAEFEEYENLAVVCPNPECKSIEVFNMNIPVNDTDEPFETGELPVEEEIQRYYLRLLIREIREDFVGLT
ncbi:hypothetical protein [Bacillus sp. J33]|uniref:hypothetical protein n=1 Tax=Bacillus sp. J33 TaxID=935836 RepID=UPI00047DDC33|nr:hypothetical protein [Bacillus sp. J33]